MTMDANKPFTGHKKVPMRTLLAPYERKFIDWLTPKLAPWVETWHLTLMTVPWCIGLVGFGWLAGSTGNLRWLWLSSLMIFLQWFTDAFDGAVGRHKDTGLLRWGFYMDHFLDFVFLASILIGYSFLFEGHARQIVYFLIPAFGAFMVSSFLAFGATGEFKITYLWTGPTEMRLWFIAVDTAIILWGTSWIEPLLIYILVLSVLLVAVTVYRSSRYIWRMDMDIKARGKGEPGGVRV
jgi:phosphatidylglycerophosphate synthase